MGNPLEKYSEENGVYCEAPMLEGMHKKIAAVFKNYSSIKLKNEYFPLLNFSDGVQIENVFLHSSQVLLNSENQEKDLLVLGHNGNMDAFIFHAKAGEYRVVNFFDHDEVSKTFDSFNALLMYILNSQGVTNA